MRIVGNPSNKRIVIFESTRPYNPTIGGSYRSLRVIVEGLAEAGFDIHVISYVNNSFLKFPNLPNVSHIVIPHYSLRSLLSSTQSKTSVLASSQGHKRNQISLKSFISIISSYFFLVFNVISIIKMIGKIKPDLIYCNTGIVSDRAAILAGILRKKKLICHLRNLPSLNFFDRYLSRKVTGAVAISNAVANHYYQSNCIFNKLLVLLNSLGKEFEQQEYIIGGAVEAYNEDFKIGCFSRLIPWKGLSTLIKAFYKYRQMGGKGTLDIYGDGPIRRDLIDAVEGLKLSDYVTFQGHREDVVDAMKSCSLIIAPSDKEEPLGRTVMEAKRLGIPVIASNGGGFLETIRHERDGLLFIMQSDQSLAEMILRLYNDKILRIRLATSGLKQSKSWSSDKYCNILFEFLSKTI